MKQNPYRPSGLKHGTRLYKKMQKLTYPTHVVSTYRGSLRTLVPQARFYLKGGVEEKL